MREKKSIFKQLGRPYLYFLLTGMLLCMACLCIGNRSLDVNVHDTYFIIAYSHIGIGFFTVFCVYSGIYFLIRRQANAVLSLLHFMLGLPFFILLYLHTFFLFVAAPRRYYTNAEAVFDDFSFLDNPYGLALSLFLLAQVFFVVNIILSLIRASKT